MGRKLKIKWNFDLKIEYLMKKFEVKSTAWKGFLIYLFAQGFW